MKENFAVVFLESAFGDVKLLGRTAREYTLREFADCDCSFANIDNFSPPTSGICVVLTLDMPLVRIDDINSVLSAMRRKQLDFLRLGGADSLSAVYAGGADGRYFADGGPFIKVDSAKSCNIVYNRLKERILDGHLSRGVFIYDTSSVFVDDTAKLESGAVILPFTRIVGCTEVGAGATVGASFVSDSIIGEGAEVTYSHVCSSRVGARANVGPFARLRGAEIGEGCRIGDFVEVKASTLKTGVKAAHLTYIGDAEVGEGTNVGCGTVFCNYDGKDKHRTLVGKDCFIGANVNLIAPVSVGDGAFIAAGTTVHKSVDGGTFTIGRVRQESKLKKPAQAEKSAREEKKE